MLDVHRASMKQADYLLYGEVLAHAGAKALASAMPDEGLRRAYRRQAEDELQHAALFREYFASLGIEPLAAPRVPELDPFRDLLLGAAERGDLMTVVMGVNVALEGLSCVAFDASARWVEASGQDPAWVRVLREIERDERRHVRLALPALRILGGGALPREASEVLAEVREVAAATASAMGHEFSAWGIDAVALFDVAVGQVHEKLLGELVDPSRRAP
jgi:hypothetical protein